MLTPARAGALLVRVPERAAAAATDTLVALAVGAPVRLRLAITPSLVTGHAPWARVTIPDVRVGGLHLAAVDVRAHQVRIPARWPVRLRADRVIVRVHVEQEALDRWTRSSALPLRVALRAGTIRARTGIAGRRLGELEIAVQLDGGRLRLVPGRMSMLGVAVNTTAAIPPVTLPLPPLPRRATLVAVEPADRAIDLALELTNVDEPVTPDGIKWLAHALRERGDRRAASAHHRRPDRPASAAPSWRAAAGSA